ncbi:hypothetical protein BS47DRAFT_1366615 [Hydnum rufescens UP504]|uniref:Uncharacterized protein n=1 Tax=Hydnum rufescens UP504 TaxID=1448309 RepID=A0A9P6AKF0_9AGAM|nr:hypothetical protein BS47DRAFT_1366615 [Hydnum rufescens UP504]
MSPLPVDILPITLPGLLEWPMTVNGIFLYPLYLHTKDTYSAPDSRQPPHQYSRSSDHIPYSSPFNVSETSLGTCAELVDELLQNGILKFQEGALAEQNQEWHRLVSEEFRLSLSKSEIERQSTIFELIKSEKDYVEDVFIRPLMEASPPVITPETRLRTFRNEIFQNITDIAARHRGFSKQYPIAEDRHRRELKSNKAYAEFLQSVSRDPRLRRRDLITFISRPVTRLPRISLILEHIYKLTDPEHPDIETMPLTLTILSDFLKSTQVGIAVADARVKFWELCESLVYRPGEIIDMDLYDVQRHLVSAGVVARRNRTDFDWHGWRDVNLAVLDNYLLITSSEVRLERTFRVLVSRPIPLECLGLGSFKDAPENRREESEGGSRFLDALIKPTKPVHPFTIFHKLDFRRRYTFYAHSEASRLKWYDTLVDAIGVRKAYLDANRLAEPYETLHTQWYSPDILDDAKVPPDSRKDFSGRIVGATTFCKITTPQGRLIEDEMVYAAKSFRHTSVHALKAFSRVPTVKAGQQDGEADATATFRRYGSPFNTPKDTYGVTFLQRYLAIANSNGIVIMHPTAYVHLRPNSEILMFPDWEAPSDASPQAHGVLKARCHDARPLGLMQAGDSQLLVVYESFGCYLTKYGVPTRKCGMSFLLGQTSIEVRVAATGQLLHIIQGNEIRLVQKILLGSGPTLFARRGQKDDVDGLSDELLELLETSPVVAPPMDSSILWEEWD